MPPLYKTWVEGRSVSLSQVNSLQVNIFYRLFWGSHPRIEARILLAVIQIIWNDDDAGFTRAWYVSSIRAPKNPACKICLLTRQGFSPYCARGTTIIVFSIHARFCRIFTQRTDAVQI